jgi:SAM-dependent methyltransferase
LRLTGRYGCLSRVRHARELSRTSENIDFRQADVSTCDLPPAAFDCIATIATLHHLPLDDTLKTLEAALPPGGVLLVVDLYQPRTLADWIWSAWGYVANLLLSAWKLRRLRQAPHVRQAWAEHARHDVYPTLAEIRSTGARLLPGAAVRRHLFWRYSLIWRKSAAL